MHDCCELADLVMVHAWYTLVSCECAFCRVKLKQLHHRNVNEFVGAYVSPPAVYVCMAFCSKGSLWDVINQQSTLLSWDFRVSLIVDIAKVVELSQACFEPCCSSVYTFQGHTFCVY